MKSGALLLVMFLMIAACGDGGSNPQTTGSVSTTVVSSSAAPTSAAPTTVVDSTLPPASTVTPVAAKPLVIPRLDNGLPATFVAVTEDWEAVEVDSATGNVIRSIGLGEKRVESEEDGMVSSAIDQVWRTSDQDWFIVSQCCEPAAGMIYYVRPGEVLTPDNRLDGPITFAWTVAPSPFDGRLIRSGYYMEVAPVDGEPFLSLPLDQPGGPGFATGVAAWDLTGTRISWISNNWTPDGGAMLVHLDLDNPDVGPNEIEIDWVEPGQWIDGLGTQASGNLVAFLNTQDPDPESSTILATEGVVFGWDGELIARFAVETGSAWGGYEPSGRMLIYTDGANNVRWQGLGHGGILAEGFVHASW